MYFQFEFCSKYGREIHSFKDINLVKLLPKNEGKKEKELVKFEICHQTKG